jgi:hypothetical protein
MSENDIKINQIVNDKIKKFGEKLNEKLTANIVEPVTRVIARIDGMDRRIDKVERTVIDRLGAPPNSSASQALDQITDPAIDMLPLHVRETMQFVLLMTSMAEGKKKFTDDEIETRISNDYGKVMGKSLAASLLESLKESKRQNLKNACDELVKRLGKTK